MKLVKPLVIGNLVIPAGTELIFDENGEAEFHGLHIDLSQVPEQAIGDIAANYAQEAVTLKTKGQLAVDMLISAIITIFAACPQEDRNALRRVLTNARQASTTSTPMTTFKKLMKIDK